MNLHLEEEEQFQNVIFTDECTVQLEYHRRKSLFKNNALRKLKYCHKHPPKIHIRGGISIRCTDPKTGDGKGGAAHSKTTTTRKKTVPSSMIPLSLHVSQRLYRPKWMNQQQDVVRAIAIL